MSGKWIAAVAAGVAMFLGAASPMAFGQGVGGSSPTDTSHVLSRGFGIPEPPVDWQSVVGTSLAPVGVELDPVGPAWIQHFQTEGGAPINADRYIQITEDLVVTGDTPWTGWHVEPANPDFRWFDWGGGGWGHAFVAIVNGVLLATDVQYASPGILDATFPAIGPGDEVRFIYYFRRDSVNPVSDSFDIHQYPTPEPTALLLIGTAGAVYSCAGRHTSTWRMRTCSHNKRAF